MRATGPKDQIEFKGHYVALPLPTIKIGDRVDLEQYKGHEDDKAYFFSQAVRQLLRDHRKVVDRLRREGYLDGKPGTKLPDHNKALVRDKLDMMRFADSVEVAGLYPQGMQVTGGVANQCYLQNGQSHGGVEYQCFLLFRREVDGRKLAYIHPYPLARARALVVIQRDAAE